MRDAMTNGAMEYRSPLSDRIWRKLGFRHAHVDRPDSENWMVTDVRCSFSLLDRLRILLSGVVGIQVVTETDVAVRHAKSTTDAKVLKPGTKVRR